MRDRAHHVWVRLVHMPTEMPGLVLEWRRNGPDWEALVTYVEPRGPTGRARKESESVEGMMKHRWDEAALAEHKGHQRSKFCTVVTAKPDSLTK